MTIELKKQQRRVQDYYKTVKGYHALAEESHVNEMISVDILLRYIKPSSIVLDIAGGTGYNAELLNIPSTHYICTDFSAHALQFAKEKNRGTALQTDAAKLPIRDNSVDIVLCSWSLEHMVEPETILSEMIRTVRPRGFIMIWGPNWDNVFRKDFPQFEHKSRLFIMRMRWKIFFKMLKNEFLPFSYHPYVNTDVAAFANPERYIAYDYDATHSALCQETVKFFRQKKCRIVHISDFTEWTSHVRNDAFIRTVRVVLKPMLPILKRLPLLRWFVIRFPLVVEKIQQ